ncbi:uncharacterized protein ACNLHF_020580 [Anomaloglossus baeobatrachus]
MINCMENVTKISASGNTELLTTTNVNTTVDDITWPYTAMKEEPSDEESHINITTEHLQPCAPLIKEEFCSYVGNNRTNIHAPIHHTPPDLCSQIKEETADLYKYTKNTQLYSSTHVKEEIFPIYTPNDHSQQHLYCIKTESFTNDRANTSDHTQYISIHIKEEYDSTEADDLIYSGIHIGTNHAQEDSCAHIKEESISSSAGNLGDNDIYKSADLAQQYLPNLKEDSVSDEDAKLAELYTHADPLHYMSLHIKEEPISCEEGITDTDLYLPIGHAQYTFSHITDESTSYEEVNLSNIDIYTPTDDTQYTTLSTFTDEYGSEDTNQSPEDTDFLCSTCGKYFKTASLLQKHQQVHICETPYSCTECSKYFSSNSNLIAHKRTHTGEKPYCCPKCGKSFSTNSNLIAHQKIHTGAKQYSCFQCGKCFSSNSYLIVHHRIHTGEKPYSCSECGKRFTSYSERNRHQRIHTGEKPYSCPVCGKAFLSSSERNSHQRIHTKEKPYSCMDCGKRFIRNSDFIKHQRIHTDERPYPCSECGKCFRSSSELNRHHRFHTGEKPFSCPSCDKCFLNNSKLLRHQKSHTGEKPFSCSECGKCFMSNSHLVRHQRVHIR